MTGEITIERVRADELEDVVRIFAHLGARYSAPADDPRTREVFELYVNDERKVGLVARQEGRAVGVLLFEITPVLSPTLLHARADGMAVLPEARGRGIGHRLLRRAFEMAGERGITSFLIKASDPDVIAMYRRMPELSERGVYFYYNPDRSVVDEKS